MSEDGGGFAGFTRATFTGQIPGGRPGAHGACATEFAGSHLCHAAEYFLGSSATALPADGAWLDPSGDLEDSWTDVASPRAGRSVNSYACWGWTRGVAGTSGTALSATGLDNTKDCATARPLACCSTPSKVRFAGFTPTATKGNAGGRPKMNALCSAAFAGSHLCHAAEYFRASSATLFPASGAWIDPSGFGKSSWTAVALPEAGRAANSYACWGWTRDVAGTSGTALSATGLDNTKDCSTALPVACCY